jgi:dTDP-4-amino-4,6-dideoxygalactose transaminase
MSLATATDFIRVSKSSVGADEAAALADVIEDGRLGMGAVVGSFEKDLAEFIGGAKQVVCVSTGTSALQLALEACGIGPGHEVLVPTLTYVASFQAISATGAVPIPCDVREHDCWLDVQDAEKRITPKTVAIMPMHYASNPGDLKSVYSLARRHGLRVIEDAAHAFGCQWNGARMGALGDVVCFSFDGIKNITSGEGGAVVTSDKQVAERVRNARLLGVENDTEKRMAGQRSWEFDVRAQGWRYHMSNLCAAIGRVQLRRLVTEFAPRRIVLARRYQELLAPLFPACRTLPLEYGTVVPHIFPIIIEDGRRNLVRRTLADYQIESGIHYKPNHLLSFYGGGRTRLPVAESLYEKLLTLPLHPDLGYEQQDTVVNVVRDALGGQP